MRITCTKNNTDNSALHIASVKARFSGLNEKVEEVLNSYYEQIQRYEEKVKALESRIEFCANHNFNEEKRITRVQLDELNMPIYKWRNMANDLQTVIDEWNA